MLIPLVVGKPHLILSTNSNDFHELEDFDDFDDFDDDEWTTTLPPTMHADFNAGVQAFSAQMRQMGAQMRNSPSYTTTTSTFINGPHMSYSHHQQPFHVHFTGPVHSTTIKKANNINYSSVSSHNVYSSAQTTEHGRTVNRIENNPTRSVSDIVIDADGTLYVDGRMTNIKFGSHIRQIDIVTVGDKTTVNNIDISNKSIFEGRTETLDTVKLQAKNYGDNNYEIDDDGTLLVGGKRTNIHLGRNAELRVHYGEKSVFVNDHEITPTVFVDETTILPNNLPAGQPLTPSAFVAASFYTPQNIKLDAN